MSDKKKEAPARRPHAKYFDGVKSMTHQSFKDECDVNNIMAKFEQTALLEHVNTHQGRYGDFTNTPQSFQEAMEQTIAARDMFMTLPAKVRKEFDNDPGQFVEFVEGADEDQLRERGLLPGEDPSQTAPGGAPQGPGGEPETSAEPAGAE